MNREVEGTQETVLFYVDDIKLSHVNEEVVLNTVKELIARYRKVRDLTVTLDMVFLVSDDVCVRVAVGRYM